MTIKEAANLWKISETIVSKYCRNGRIDGAEKIGNSWYIPEGAVKPTDKRITSGKYSKKSKEHLPLPIGISDYKKASSEYYYVDKTMMIKDFLDEKPLVSLFTRPRRFGKTLNMDMLRTFFEVSENDTASYFADKKIWSFGKKYKEYQGKYPVIFVSFKDVKFDTWEETLDNLKDVFKDEYSRHRKIIESDSIAQTDKLYFNKVLNKDVNNSELSAAFKNLSRMLDDYYKIAPIIIIDEYDTPIQQGYSKNYYDKVIDFMRNLFSGGLKDNKHLSFGFLTGILRVAKESIFSGLNNLVTYSILDEKYSQYFGFTKEEVAEMASYYEAGNKLEEICEWYDGYCFGGTEIFNPWSVINYFSNNCKAKAFWQSTGSNEIISEVISVADEDTYERLEKLLQGEKFKTIIDTGVIYPQIKTNPSTVYSFLLVAGYLKAENSEFSVSGDYICDISLPNKEIKAVYNKEVLQKLNSIVSQSSAVAIQEAIYSNNTEALQKQLRKLLLSSASSYDTSGEMFFHGLVLGICALFDDKYYVSSNRESGEGRFDIQLMPKNNKRPGIIIELKADKKLSDMQLKNLAESALKQINDKVYDTDMKLHGVSTIFRYGVAFSGKKVEICSD